MINPYKQNYMLNQLVSLLRLNIDECYKQVYIKSINENISPYGMDYTLYFQLVNLDIFIPVDLPFDSGQNIAMVFERDTYPRPHVYDTLKRTIHGLGAKPKAVIIATYSSGIYYTFIQIEKDRKCIDIDAKFSDAISLAIVCKIPIFIEEKLSKILGIEVSSADI